jgi:hypothetical protein
VGAARLLGKPKHRKVGVPGLANAAAETIGVQIGAIARQGSARETGRLVFFFEHEVISVVNTSVLTTDHRGRQSLVSARWF